MGRRGKVSVPSCHTRMRNDKGTDLVIDSVIYVRSQHCSHFLSFRDQDQVIALIHQTHSAPERMAPEWRDTGIVQLRSGKIPNTP